MTEVFAKDCNKFDIIIEVKTLCRKSKTTPWAELVENGFKVGDQEWEESDKVTKSSGEGHARLGLLTSYLTDVNRYLDPAIAKAILPEMSGVANGLGKIVLVGYVEGSRTPHPLITALFEFSQKPGERIKVSKSIQDCFKREDELKALDVKGPQAEERVCVASDVQPNVYKYPEVLGGVKEHVKLWNDLKAFIITDGSVPQLIFASNNDIPRPLWGRSFSPQNGFYVPRDGGVEYMLIAFLEHKDGMLAPVFNVLAKEDESEDPVIMFGNGDYVPTEEDHQIVSSVILALRQYLLDVPAKVHTKH